MKLIGLFGIVLLLAVSLAAAFSHHGFLDFLRFRGQLQTTREHIAQIEDQNRQLRSELDLLENPSPALVERQARTLLGWVKPSEIVYFESHNAQKPGK